MGKHYSIKRSSSDEVIDMTEIEDTLEHADKDSLEYKLDRVNYEGAAGYPNSVEIVFKPVGTNIAALGKKILKLNASTVKNASSIQNLRSIIEQNYNSKFKDRPLAPGEAAKAASKIWIAFGRAGGDASVRHSALKRPTNTTSFQDQLASTDAKAVYYNFSSGQYDDSTKNVTLKFKSDQKFGTITVTCRSTMYPKVGSLPEMKEYVSNAFYTTAGDHQYLSNNAASKAAVYVWDARNAHFGKANPLSRLQHSDASGDEFIEHRLNRTEFQHPGYYTPNLRPTVVYKWHSASLKEDPSGRLNPTVWFDFAENVPVHEGDIFVTTNFISDPRMINNDNLLRNRIRGAVEQMAKTAKNGKLPYTIPDSELMRCARSIQRLLKQYQESHPNFVDKLTHSAGNYYVVDSDYLEHHGVLGMKWGVRRYQNKDGSLTDAGRRHYAPKANRKEAKRQARATRNEEIKKRNINIATERLNQRIKFADTSLQTDKYAGKIGWKNTQKAADSQRVSEATKQLSSEILNDENRLARLGQTTKNARVADVLSTASGVAAITAGAAIIASSGGTAAPLVIAALADTATIAAGKAFYRKTFY